MMTKPKSSNNSKYRSSSNERETSRNELSNNNKTSGHPLLSSSAKFKLNEHHTNNDRLKHLNLINNKSNFRNDLMNSSHNLISKDLKYNCYFSSSASSLLDSTDSSSALFVDEKKSRKMSSHYEKENQVSMANTRLHHHHNNNNNHHNYRPEKLSTSTNNLYNIKNEQESKCEEESVKYGELIVLGYNGCISQSSYTSSSLIRVNGTNNAANRRKSKYILKRREKPNGVRPATQHNCQSSQEANNLTAQQRNHSVTYTMSRNHTVVVQYMRDENTDMFQIGRSSENAIDFIILDTVVPPTTTPQSSPTSSLLPIMSNINSNNQQAKQQQQQNDPAAAAAQTQQSTISRFSCRICVDRDYPYTARIYAAGFDSSKSIFLGEKATKWKNDKGELDGVTTNGVLIMHPSDGFHAESQAKKNEWLEVSVCGSVFSLNESRLAPCLIRNNSAIKESPSRSNVLRDGTLIDLCGATLVWRSVDSLTRTPTKHYLDMNLENLNSLRPQCPVGLKTLVFPSSASPLNTQNQIHSSLFPHLNQNSKNICHSRQKKTISG